MNNFIRIAGLAALVCSMNGAGLAAAFACEDDASIEALEPSGGRSSALLRGGVYSTGTSGPRQPWARVPATTQVPSMAPTYIGTRVARGG